MSFVRLWCFSRPTLVGLRNVVTNVGRLLSFRVTKPLPTFTSLVADWHPDKAAHLGPCNLCHKKNQTRTMVLDR